MIANELTFNAVHSIEVFRPPGLVCENRLPHPDGIIDQTGSLCLPPSDGTATLLTDIFRISIQDESLAIPCSLQCGASPLFLHDTPENTITITLEEIANALGNLITSGWLVCQTPYGFLSGENDLTPGWPYGSSIAIPIHNGTASFTYTPQGETPDNLSFLIPIEIFPYEHGKSFDSRRIGIIEIFMTKQL